MKKRKIILILFFLFLLSGCSSSFNDKKPSTSYYTNLLEAALAAEPKSNIVLLDLNFYKERPLQGEEVTFVKNFFKYLNKQSFIQKPADLPQNPLYKYFFTFTETKYVINVYNDKYLSIYPWDGNYLEDYVSMDGVVKAYNLYNLCKYFIPKY